MIEGLILLATFLVAYANGANDNFKGVATLFGSGTADYRKVLRWATVTTFAGSFAAFFLAQGLIQSFSGKGLVPDTVITQPIFLLSVMLGAGLTVLFASKLGIPISTTHSLVGALGGAGFVAVGSRLGIRTLAENFLLPLILSPFLAIGVTVLLYSLLKWGRARLGIGKTTCVCIGERLIPVGTLVLEPGQILTIAQLKTIDVLVDEKEACQAKAFEVYQGRLFGVSAQKILDGLHFLSAGAVSFARGLNDTPKIAALAVAAKMLDLRWNVALVALAIALGGILGAKKVAQTMSHRITRMNHGHGFAANLVTAFLVIVASFFGLPVSTTHVSCGALFGLGAASGKAQWKTITNILFAWALTLPVASFLSASIFLIVSTIRN